MKHKCHFCLKVTYAAGLWNFFFFAVLVFLGPFYLINLISAVVVTSYEIETTSTSEEVCRINDYSIY